MEAIKDSALVREAGPLIGYQFTVASSRYEIVELWEYQSELWLRAACGSDQLSVSLAEAMDYGLIDQSRVPARLRRRDPDIVLTNGGRKVRR